LTYDPILAAPFPPGQERTNCGSQYKETGLNVPVVKYGPTGHKRMKNNALVALETPKLACGLSKYEHKINTEKHSL